jgi:putative transposase
MRRMDELYLAHPFYGSRRMAAVLRREGWAVNRKRMRRLMRLMGLQAIYQKPNTSRAQPEHRVHPYLLRGLTIDRPNQSLPPRRRGSGARTSHISRWPKGLCIWWR